MTSNEELKPCPFGLDIKKKKYHYKYYLKSRLYSKETLEDAIDGVADDIINFESFILQQARSKREEALQARIDELEKQKDSAYNERNQLVAALSKHYPSNIGFHDPEDRTWDDEWRHIIYIELPTGQASWHIHDDDLKYFIHLELTEEYYDQWDRHTTLEKYERLAALPASKQGEESCQ